MANERTEAIERFRKKLAGDIYDRWRMTGVDTMEHGGPIEALCTATLTDHELYYLAYEASYEFVDSMLSELYLLYIDYHEATS